MAGKPRESGNESELSLGKAAHDSGLITPEQLKEALSAKARETQSGKKARPLSEILVSMGYLSPEQVAAILRRLQGGGGDEGTEIRTRAQAPAPTYPPFGKYQILRELGKGGMGIVYEAMDTALDRKVALKMMIVSPNADPEEIKLEQERFVRESKLAAKLPKHRHIVGVYEVGVIDDKYYLAMELVEGMSFKDWQKSGSVDVRRQITVLRDVLLAVHHAHQNEVVHRDLKPQNVLVDAKMEPHVLDFGLAKSLGPEVSKGLTITGMLVGTPYYMSPEQAQGNKTVGPPSDVYSMGSMLYEILTGRPPFTGETPIEVLMKVVKDPVAPPSSLVRTPNHPARDKTLENICLKALAKAAKQRYQTAEAFAQDLTRWLKGQEVRVEAPRQRAKGPIVIKKSNPWIYVMISSVAAAVVLVVIVTMVNKEKQDKPPKPPPVVIGPPPDEGTPPPPVETTPPANTTLPPVTTTTPPPVEPPPVGPPPVVDARLLPVRARHAEAVLALAFSADGKLVATAGADAAVKIWEVATGKGLAVISALGGPVRGVAFSPDGKSLATSGATPKIWNWETEKEKRALRGHNVPVQAVAWSPDGTTVVTGGEDGKIMQFDAGTGRQLGTLPGHEGAVTALRIAPDGRTMASADADRVVKLWNLGSGKSIATIKAHEAAPEGTVALAYSFDSKKLATGGSDHVIKLWEVPSGQSVATIDKGVHGVGSLGFVKDGTSLLSGGHDGTLMVWDPANGAARGTVAGAHADLISCLECAGTALATGSADKSVKVWKLPGLW